MKKDFIAFNGEKNLSSLFFPEQIRFITDADILLGGFEIILKNDKNCGVNFLTKLNTLHKQINYRLEIMDTLSNEYEIDSFIIHSFNRQLKVIENLLLKFTEKDNNIIV